MRRRDTWSASTIQTTGKKELETLLELLTHLNVFLGTRPAG